MPQQPGRASRWIASFMTLASLCYQSPFKKGANQVQHNQPKILTCFLHKILSEFILHFREREGFIRLCDGSSTRRKWDKSARQEK